MNSSEIHKQIVLKGKAVHFQRPSKKISKKIPQSIFKQKLSIHFLKDFYSESSQKKDFHPFCFTNIVIKFYKLIKYYS